MKDIKPYLHLYLDAQVQVRKKNDKDREYLIGRICEVTSGSNHGDWIKVWFDECHTVTNDTWNELTSNAHHYFINHDEIKLILRRLSDMSEEEAKELCKLQTIEKRWPDVEVLDISHSDIHYTDGSKLYGDGVEELNDRYVHFDSLNAEQFSFLLRSEFDLFGLIDSGLAIDKKTLK